MNTVIYTHDFEPITIIDVPVWLLDEIERQGTCRVTVAGLVGNTQAGKLTPEESQQVPLDKIITLELCKVRWRDGTLKPILLADNEELVLILKPEWLAGQRQEINYYKQTIKQLHQALRNGEQ